MVINNDAELAQKLFALGADVDRLISLGLPPSLAIDSTVTLLSSEIGQEYIRTLKVSLIKSAIAANDLDYLQTIQLDEPSYLNQEINNKIKGKQVNYDFLLKLRDYVLSKDIDLEKMRVDNTNEIGIIFKRICLRKNDISLATDIFNKGENIKLILDYWVSGSLPFSWNEVLSLILDLEKKQSVSSMKSIDSKSQIRTWCDPFLHNNLDNQQINLVKKNLGLITRLKWSRLYKRGSHVEKEVSKNISSTDLIYGL